MLRKIIATLVMLFAFTNPLYADIATQEVENAPFGWYLTYAPIKEKNTEMPDKTAVADEVYHLNKFLEQKTFNWTVNIVKQRAVITNNGVLSSGTKIYGVAGRDGNAYMFSYPVISVNDRGYFSKLFDANVVAHEVGHLARFEFISDSSLCEYVELRKDGKEHSDYVDLPEELFAEDFRWLFSSEKSRKEYYKPYYPKPGEKERKWILEKLGMEYIPPKVEEIKIITAPSMLIAPKIQPKPKLIPVKKPKPIKKVTKSAYKSR